MINLHSTLIIPKFKKNTNLCRLKILERTLKCYCYITFWHFFKISYLLNKAYQIVTFCKAFLCYKAAIPTNHKINNKILRYTTCRLYKYCKCCISNFIRLLWDKFKLLKKDNCIETKGKIFFYSSVEIFLNDF